MKSILSAKIMLRVDYKETSRYKIWRCNFGSCSGEEAFVQRNLKDELKEGLRIDKEIAKLIRFRKFLYEKRNNFFYSEFNKLSVRVLEYLKLCGITHLAIPTNLASLKNNGKNEMNSENMQKFMQIPFMQLVK